MPEGRPVGSRTPAALPPYPLNPAYPAAARCGYSVCAQSARAQIVSARALMAA